MKQKIFFVMGVSGSGKSTIGKALASKLGYQFYDGDDFHPQANIDKMKAGSPLDDNDRRSWLWELNQLAQSDSTIGKVIACSALKQSYRNVLKLEIEHITSFIYLKGSFDKIKERLQQRSGHFMPVELLKSQFNDLEEPVDAIIVSIEDQIDTVIEKINVKIEQKERNRI